MVFDVRTHQRNLDSQQRHDRFGASSHTRLIRDGVALLLVAWRRLQWARNS